MLRSAILPPEDLRLSGGFPGFGREIALLPKSPDLLSLQPGMKLSYGAPAGHKRSLGRLCVLEQVVVGKTSKLSTLTNCADVKSRARSCSATTAEIISSSRSLTA
jgi:hypothetical protein